MHSELLAACWRVFHHWIQIYPELVDGLVQACAMLHNYLQAKSTRSADCHADITTEGTALQNTGSFGSNFSPAGAYNVRD